MITALKSLLADMPFSKAKIFSNIVKVLEKIIFQRLGLKWSWQKSLNEIFHQRQTETFSLELETWLCSSFLMISITLNLVWGPNLDLLLTVKLEAKGF